MLHVHLFGGLSLAWHDESSGITSFAATLTAGHGAILLQEETGSEIGSLGFRLFRSDSPEDNGQSLNGDLIPSQAYGSPLGAAYSWMDSDLEPGIVYTYRLESVDIHGVGTMYGPVQGYRLAPAKFRAYLPMVHRGPQGRSLRGERQLPVATTRGLQNARELALPGEQLLTEGWQNTQFKESVSVSQNTTMQ